MRHMAVGLPLKEHTQPDLRHACPFHPPSPAPGQNLALAEARTALAMLVARFRLSVAPRMGTRDDVRAKEVMKLTLQVSGGQWLALEERK